MALARCRYIRVVWATALPYLAAALASAASSKISI